MNFGKLLRFGTRPGLLQFGNKRNHIGRNHARLRQTRPIQCLWRTRSTNPKLQAIIITGFPTPETKTSAKDLGVFSYVTKPFGILDILGTCDSAIRAARGES